MQFHITSHGIQHAIETFDGIALNASDTRPAMEEIYLTILDIEAEAFEKEGARSGFPKWQALLYTTEKAKKERGQILVDFGKLRKSMTEYRSPDATVRIHKDYIVFAPNLERVPYGRIQRLGGWQSHGRGGGKTHIPARDYIRFSKTDSAAFAKEIARHLMRRRGPGSIAVTIAP